MLRTYLSVLNTSLTSQDKARKFTFNSLDKTTQAPITEVLSLKFSEVIPALINASDIEKKALRLINMPRAITENPTLDINKNHKTYFVAGEKQQKYYTVVKSEKNTLKCNYKGFEYACVFSHTVAVA